MSILGSIWNAIVGKAHAADGTTPAAPGTAPAGGSGGGLGGIFGTTPANVDVTAILNKLQSDSKEKLDWKNSIVDLMKLLNLDSSLTARKTLAKELNYTGDTGDSAKMNIWLHEQVLKKLAANGGKVPAELIKH